MGDVDDLQKLVDQYLELYRAGTAPSVEEFAEQHPEQADAIREYLPIARSMESLGSEPDEPAEPPKELGDYRILREIGRGGMGVVYEAEQITLDRHVALKVLPFHARTSQVNLDRFSHEARAAARLHHTNIVPVFGVGRTGNTHYYAMQYINGKGLNDVIKEVRELRSRGLETSPLANARETHSPRNDYFHNVADLGQQVADALAYAHRQGVLHRDIKPSNLMLDHDKTVWVTDFGLAKTVGASGHTQSGDLVGTLAYMAPERLVGRSDERSDIYGLGATLYELATLQPAFERDHPHRMLKRIAEREPLPPRAIDPTIPRDLETIILKAIAKDPSRRYRKAGALREDLHRFRDGLPILARRSGLMDRSVKWAKRRPTAAALVAVSILAIALTLALWAKASRAEKVVVSVQDQIKELEKGTQVANYFLLVPRLDPRLLLDANLKALGGPDDLLVAKRELLLAFGEVSPDAVRTAAWRILLHMQANDEDRQQAREWGEYLLAQPLLRKLAARLPELEALMALSTGDDARALDALASERHLGPSALALRAIAEWNAGHRVTARGTLELARGAPVAEELQGITAFRRRMEANNLIQRADAVMK
ncbi:MAG: serine/threonine-protein kinase [Planctomycetota bacterium]|jgi:serine/threonine protein kinase